MTPERAKELLPVITAFAEGKTIQFKTKLDDKWTDSVEKLLSFNNRAAIYRVKPEKVKKNVYLVVDRRNGISSFVFPSYDSAEQYLHNHVTCSDSYEIIPVTYEVELL